MAFVAQQLQSVGLAKHALYHTIPCSKARLRVDYGFDVVNDGVVNSPLLTCRGRERSRYIMWLPPIPRTLVDAAGLASCLLDIPLRPPLSGRSSQCSLDKGVIASLRPLASVVWLLFGHQKGENIPVSKAASTVLPLYSVTSVSGSSHRSRFLMLSNPTMKSPVRLFVTPSVRMPMT